MSEKIVNVASVTMRSPFRYPGGKTWLVPRVHEWIDSCSRGRGMRSFIEPFVGGGSVALSVAADRLADQVTMVELDPDVAAVWETIINDTEGPEWLAARIMEFDLTPTTVAEIIASETPASETPASDIPASKLRLPELFTPETDITRERAFRTIVRNRVARGGIIAPGAGIIRSGEGGRGLLSRWYPETLRRRILHIATYRERITFFQGDGIEVLQRHVDDPNALFFIDPPYSAAGKRAGSRLYSHPDINHPELFCLCATLRSPFLMTYDNTKEIQTIATQHGFSVESINMRNTHNTEMKELLINNY